MKNVVKMVAATALMVAIAAPTIAQTTNPAAAAGLAKAAAAVAKSDAKRAAAAAKANAKAQAALIKKRPGG